MKPLEREADMNFDHQIVLDTALKKGEQDKRNPDFPPDSMHENSTLFSSAHDNLSSLISNFSYNSLNTFNKSSYQLLKSLEIIKQTTGNLLDASSFFEQDREQRESDETFSHSLTHLMAEIVKMESIILDKPSGTMPSLVRPPLTEQKKISLTDWQHLAYTDSVTELPNRRYFEFFMQNLLLSSTHEQVDSSLIDSYLIKHNPKKFYIIFIDIDNFKQINDTYGHDCGDFLLRMMAQRLKNNLREKDLVARYGGDEFVAFIHPLTHPHQLDIDIKQIVDRLMDMSQIPYKIKDICLTVTLSFGVSCYPDHGETVEELVCRADRAMYSSKGSGKNTYTMA